MVPKQWWRRWSYPRRWLSEWAHQTEKWRSSRIYQQMTLSGTTFWFCQPSLQIEIGNDRSALISTVLRCSLPHPKIHPVQSRPSTYMEQHGSTSIWDGVFGWNCKLIMNIKYTRVRWSPVLRVRRKTSFTGKCKSLVQHNCPKRKSNTLQDSRCIYFKIYFAKSTSTPPSTTTCEPSHLSKPNTCRRRKRVNNLNEDTCLFYQATFLEIYHCAHFNFHQTVKISSRLTLMLVEKRDF